MPSCVFQVEYGSSAADHAVRIWSSSSLVHLGTPLWWQEMALRRKRSSGISDNKEAFTSYSSAHSSCAGRLLAFSFLVMLQWWELVLEEDWSCSLFNKLVSCGFHRGRSVASPRSALTAALSSSLSFMAEGRPLLPSTSGTVSPGRSLKVIFNLQAVVPLWRPLRLDAACSRLFVPSGVVPGDIEVGCGEFKSWSAGDGAVPDCVPPFLFKVRSANCKGWVVIFYFLVALSVIFNSGVEF